MQCTGDKQSWKNRPQAEPLETQSRLVESMKFGWDLQFYLKVSDDEHVKQLQVLRVHASKEVIRVSLCFLRGDCHKNFSQIVDLNKY